MLELVAVGRRSTDLAEEINVVCTTDANMPEVVYHSHLALLIDLHAGILAIYSGSFCGQADVLE